MHYKVKTEMTTKTDNRARHYRSLEVLIQSQLAELRGPEPGIVVVQPQIRQLDAYTTVGAGIDFTDSESLKLLRWVEVTEHHGVWSCDDIDDERRDRFIALVGSHSAQAAGRPVGS
jgi:hypothetical protein